MWLMQHVLRAHIRIQMDLAYNVQLGARLAQMVQVATYVQTNSKHGIQLQNSAIFAHLAIQT